MGREISGQGAALFPKEKFTRAISLRRKKDDLRVKPLPMKSKTCSQKSFTVM